MDTEPIMDTEPSSEPPVFLVVVPLQLDAHQPFVLAERRGTCLSLLRVHLNALDASLISKAERFLIGTVGLTISRLILSIATQNLALEPSVVELCYYGFAKSRFTNGDNLTWAPLYRLLPEADQRQPPSQPCSDTPDEQLNGHDRELLAATLDHLRQSLDRRPVIEEIEPEAFTLSYLQHRTEMLLGRSLHTQNFRRKILESGYVESTDLAVNQAMGRPALLYRVSRSQRD